MTSRGFVLTLALAASVGVTCPAVASVVLNANDTAVFKFEFNQDISSSPGITYNFMVTSPDNANASTNWQGTYAVYDDLGGSISYSDTTPNGATAFSYQLITGGGFLELTDDPVSYMMITFTAGRLSGTSGAFDITKAEFDISASVGIAGAVFTTGGELVQVPEPATLALFGLGLAGIGAVRRRKLTA